MEKLGKNYILHCHVLPTPGFFESGFIKGSGVHHNEITFDLDVHEHE